SRQQALRLHKAQALLQALQHIIDDGADRGVIQHLPEPGAQVALQVWIISADGWPDLVDAAEIAVQKRARQLPRNVLARFGIGREIARAHLFQGEAEVGRNALRLRATEDRMACATTVGTGTAVDVLPDLGRRLTDERIEPAV